MIDDLSVPKSHDAIENVPEPAASDFVTGHEGIAAFLAQAYHDGRMHHALLLEGPQGIGKATLAFHLATHILNHPQRGLAPLDIARPDFTTSLSRQIAGGMHPAVLHINRPFDAKTAKFRTAITVEEIRRVSHFLNRTAHDNGWRIVIVDPADDMNRNAANALLKTLEEPPTRALFMLISHSSGRLLPTIRSRCQSLAFKPLADTAMVAALEHVGPRVGLDVPSASAIAPLLARAEGSVRKALLLVAHGGIEISDTADDILAGSLFDLPKAQSLAGILSGRDADVQYHLFIEHLMGRIAGEAEHFAQAGALREAHAWSTFWSKASQDVREAETYNLDRRQMIVLLLEKVQRAFRNGVPAVT